MDPGYVYLVVCAPHNTFKIGWSANPQKRFSDLHSANPSLVFMWCFRGGRELEAWLHEQFGGYRTFQREWYSIPPEKLLEFLFSMGAIAYFFSTIQEQPAYSSEETQELLQKIFEVCHTPHAHKVLARTLCA